MKLWNSYTINAWVDIGLLKLIAAALILLFFLILRKIFARLSVRLLAKLENKTQLQAWHLVIRAVEPPARLLFVVFGLALSFHILKPPANIKIISDHLIRSLLITAVFWAIYLNSCTITGFLQRLIKSSETAADNSILSLFDTVFRVLVCFLGSTIVLKEWGYDVAGLLTGLGLGGLALALAAKETASNLFGGIVIMIDKPFTTGDWIYTPKAEGIVEGIGLRSTRIRTFDQALVTVPNSIMSNEPVTNWSRMGKRRINQRIFLAGTTSSEQIKDCVDLLRNMLKNHPGVHSDTVLVYFDRFGEGKMEILLYLFTTTPIWQEFLEIQQDINFKVMSILKDLNIQTKDGSC